MKREVHLLGALGDLRDGPLVIEADTPCECWRACEALVPGFRAAARDHAHTLSIEVGGEPVPVERLDWPLGEETTVLISPDAEGGAWELWLAIALTATATVVGLVRTSGSSRRSHETRSDLFDGPVVTATEGGALPVVYGGPVRIGPIVASAGIESARGPGGSTSTARIIDLLCEGPIRGLVDGNNSVLINGTAFGNQAVASTASADRRIALGDGDIWIPAPSREDVGAVQFRAGTANQEAVAGIPTTETEIAINRDVRHDDPTPPRQDVRGAHTSRVRVTLRFDRLTRQRSDGSVDPSEVGIAIDMSNPSDTSWQPVISETVSGRYTAPIEMSWAFDVTGPGTTIRVRRTTTDNTDKHINAFSWARLTEIAEVRQSFPYTALVGLTVSGERLESLADRAYEIYGLKVRVPSNYDPLRRTYTGDWDGTFRSTLEWSDNPAWVAYDLLENDRYGLGGQIPAAMLQAARYDFYSIALWCDELVPDGAGGTEPRYRMTLVLQTREDTIKVLRQVFGAFGAGLYEAGGQLLPVKFDDTPATVLATPVNVEDGEFKVGSDRRESYSAVAVTWNDPANGWRQATELVVDETLVRRHGHRRTSITAVGCTSRGQAHREGRHYLLKQEHEHETAQYDAGIDHISVRPGDIVIQPSDATARRLYARVTHITSHTQDNKVARRIYVDALPNKDIRDYRGNWLKSTGEIYCCHTLTTSPNGLARGFFNATGIDNQDLPAIGAVLLLEERSGNLPPVTWRVTDIEESKPHQFRLRVRRHFPDRYRLAEAPVILNEQPWITHPQELAAPEAQIESRVVTDADGGRRREQWVAITPAANSEAGEYELQIQTPGTGAWQPWIITTLLALKVPDPETGQRWQVRVRAVAGVRRSLWVMADATADTLTAQRVYLAAGGPRPAPPMATEAQRADDEHVPDGWTTDAPAPTLALPIVWCSERIGESGDWGPWRQPDIIDVRGGDNILAGDSDPNGPPVIEAAVGTIYAQSTGEIWIRGEDGWTNVVDLTPDPGNALLSGVVAPDASPPISEDLVSGDVYIATDGRWWAWEGTPPLWAYRGDLTGPSGEAGIPGINGRDGSPVYVWLAFADSADGSNNFTTDEGGGRKYMGVATNQQTATESQDWADYTWTKVLGPEGLPGGEGLPGKDGADGTAKYIWVAYANSADGLDFTTGDPGGHTWIGVLANQDTAAESQDWMDYNWVHIEGPQGVPGPPGADGSPRYIWIAYADSADGTVSFTNGEPGNRTYIGIAANKTTSTESRTASAYTWSRIEGPQGRQGATGTQGDQGVPGPPGADGSPRYIWIAYADNANGTVRFTTGAPGTRKFIGIAANKTTSTESRTASAYTWSRIEGPQGRQGATGTQGDQGVPGRPGADGSPRYIWIAYADNANGTVRFTTGAPGTRKFIGIAANKTTPTESRSASAYAWSRIEGPQGRQGATGTQGDQGVPGRPGADGSPRYIWIAYADNANGTVRFTTGAPGTRKFIGIAANKTTPTESRSASAYAWSRIEGPQGRQGATGTQGDQGVPGRAGADGSPRYIWIAYADNANGTARFTTGAPGTRKFIGIAANKTTPTESRSASAYTWSRIEGPQGPPGMPGPPGTTPSEQDIRDAIENYLGPDFPGKG